MSVRVGAVNLYNDEGAEDIAVSRVILHEDYSTWTTINDICLLHLAAEADFSSDNIGAIELPAPGQEYDDDQRCTVCSWGSTQMMESRGDLRKVDVPVVSDDDCWDAYGQISIVDSMMCAGYDGSSDSGLDFCQGASGSALMCGTGLDGLMSWGYGCGSSYPSVYTQTSFFVDWIMDNM